MSITQLHISCYCLHVTYCIQTPHELLPKLFGPLRERYAERPGGYTRVLRIEPLKEDQAPSAILELVDGPKDMRFALTARTVARLREKGHLHNEITEKNIQKVTQFRKDGAEELEKMVQTMGDLQVGDRDNASSMERRWGGKV
jgi:large subunit ribosomal protein L17